MPEVIGETLPPDLTAIRDFELFHLGGTAVTLGGLAASLILTALFLLAATLIGAAIARLRRNAGQGGASALYVVEKVLTYALVLFGLVVGLSTLGLDLSSIAVFAGGLGIGLGLGLQGVVKEFVSGIVLIFDRQVAIGDYVELETGTRGVVQEIGPRATRIRNNDNVYVLIPNSKLIEGPVINWTLKGETRRIHVPFKVALGADKEKVRASVLEAAHQVPFTLPDLDQRRTQVWLVGYGDSCLNFELVVWPTLEAVKRPKAMNAAYTWAIDDALRAASVEIPYPQREIRVRGLFGEEGEEALQTLRLDRPHAPPPPPAAPTTNDAAEDLLRGEPEPTPEPVIVEKS